MRDLYALSRSGHTVIWGWLGGKKFWRNAENEFSGPSGAVVLREYSSWLASYIAADGVKFAPGGNVMLGGKGYPLGTVEEAMRASEIWMDHAKAYVYGEGSGGVYPISSYHWQTSEVYRRAVGKDLLGNRAAGSIHGDAQHSSFDFGLPMVRVMFLQRWRRIREREEWERYREVYVENRDCREMSAAIFRVSFDGEVLG